MITPAKRAGVGASLFTLAAISSKPIQEQGFSLAFELDLLYSKT